MLVLSTISRSKHSTNCDKGECVFACRGNRGCYRVGVKFSFYGGKESAFSSKCWMEYFPLKFNLYNLSCPVCNFCQEESERVRLQKPLPPEKQKPAAQPLPASLPKGWEDPPQTYWPRLTLSFTKSLCKFIIPFLWKEWEREDKS